MLSQGLNWLLNAFAPPPTRSPAPKPATRPNLALNIAGGNLEELMTRQPTKLTPVVYDVPEVVTNSAPSSTIRPRSIPSDLNQQEQKEISVVLKQLQTIQKDPVAAQNIVAQFTGKPSATYRPGRTGDLSPQDLVTLLKEIQAIQKDPSAVRNIQAAINTKPTTTTTTSTTTTTTRRPRTTRPPPKKTLNDLNEQELGLLLKQIQAIQQNPQLAQNIDFSKFIGGATGSTPGYDDSDDDFVASGSTRKPTRSPRVEASLAYNSPEEPTMAPRKPTLPPVAFRPVSGVPNTNPELGGRLVNAAVSVTKAISSFLGSAFQVNRLTMS